MNKYTNTFCLIAWIVCALISTAYLLMLGYYNTILLDDYGFMVQLREMSPWNFASTMYMTWEGRFLPFVSSGIVMHLLDGKNNLLWYSLFLLVIGYLCIYALLKTLQPKTKNYVLGGASVIVANMIIMSYFERSTFYWICCFGYTLGLWLTILAFAVILNDKIKRLWSVPLLFVMAVYLGQLSEIYAPVLLSFGGIFFLMQLVKGGWNNLFNTKTKRKLFFSLVIIFLAFLSVLLAPGNQNRMNADGSLPFSLTGYIGMLFFCLMKILLRMHYLLVLFPVFLWIGSKTAIGSRWPLQPSWKLFRWSILIFALFIFLASFPCFVAAGFFPPDRSLTFVSLFLVVFTGFWGLLLGSRFKTATVKKVMIVAALFMSAYSALWIVEDGPKAKVYHEAIVEQHANLLQLQKDGNKKTIEVEPIPMHYLFDPLTVFGHDFHFCSYFPYEKYYLTDSPDHFTNRGLRRYLRLDFDVVQKED